MRQRQKKKRREGNREMQLRRKVGAEQDGERKRGYFYPTHSIFVLLLE